MFATKLSLLALVAPLLHVAAIQFETPSRVASGGSATIKWTAEATDPAVISIYLVNEVFHDNYGIANNVASSAGTLTLNLPSVPPGDAYTLIAVQIDNINQVYGTSGTFSIAEESSTSTPSSTRTSTTQTTRTGQTTPTPTFTQTTSGFGVTVSNTNTVPVSDSSSAPAASSSAPNAALAVKALGGNAVAFMTMIASAVIGMAVVAF